ncbi:hypothetical protein [Streptomyces bottropensis]|uniref:hypothetical protein n=1 Tax=Streptomyces bottropensis TaxID=42235 RepID=UPI0036AEF6F7
MSVAFLVEPSVQAPDRLPEFLAVRFEVAEPRGQTRVLSLHAGEVGGRAAL